ncbi:lamin tail domain-containing protein [Verrucomicrobiaceae bacterium 227]
MKPSILNLISAGLMSGVVSATPVINEILYAPDDKTTETEFVEIHNPDATAVDLGGWSLSGAIKATFPAGTSLPSGGYLLIAENPTKLASQFSIPDGVPVFAMAGYLGNEGEDVVLRDDFNQVIDLADYTNEFPWPVSPTESGASIELLHPSLDNELGGSWMASLSTATPGSLNSVYTSNPGPQLRNVVHSPKEPTDQDAILVSIKATDTDGVGALTLSYQIVAPGAYLPATLPLSYGTLTGSPSTPLSPNPAFEDPANWTSVTMAPVADESDRFEATIPAQAHRTLVRYRITATDSLGASVRAPAWDDPSKNFAAFVYNGVPDYTAANSRHPDGDGKVYSSSLLTSLPVYQLMTRPEDLQYCYAYSGTSNSGFQIAKGNRAARKIYNWECAFVYDGKVYDHVRYRLRQNNNRYAAGGKRSMRFRFNDGNHFQARDEAGDPWPVKWRTLNTGKMSTFTSATTYGLREVVNSRIWRMAGIECPYFYHIHLRVIDDAEEAPDQWNGDFFGLGMAFEDIDGRLLDARNLPDGNMYKWKDGESNPLELQRNQERSSVTNGSDFLFYKNNLNLDRSEAELADMVDWEQWSLYHTICEAVRHYDFGTASSHQKNQAWYFQPSAGSTYGKLRLIPHDHDASWGRGYHDNIRIGIGRDFPWRALFAQSATVGDPNDRSPMKPVHNLTYRNTVRNFRDLFWQEATVDLLLSETLAKIEEFTYPDRDRWLGGTRESGIETSMGAPSSIVSGMKSIAFTEDLVDGSSLAGGRAAFLDQLQNDSAIPETPVISYEGPANFPPGQLAFSSSDFSDPQGAGTYAATQWRIAEITPEQNFVQNIFTTGADWKYRDTGEDLISTFQDSTFDDSEWASGPSPLGYNESGLTTTISFGSNPGSKHLVSYFRKEFELSITDPLAEYRLKILRDDGVVVFLNGTEYTRFGIDPGIVSNETTANENAPEGIYDEVVIPASALIDGVNTLAISLHQRSRTSSDTKLDVIFEEYSRPQSAGGIAYEWEATWESGEVGADVVTPPAIATRSGRSYRVRARHLDSSGRPSHWSEPIEFVADEVDSSLYQEALVISEILVAPKAISLVEQQAGWESEDFEFIRLKNISGQVLDLSNLRFTKGIDLDLSGSLSAGEEIVLARNPAAYLSRYPGAMPLGPWSGKLKNEGELLKLSFGAGDSVREFLYFDSSAWPVSEDGAAFSLALIAPSLNPDHGRALSWRPVLDGASPVFFSGDAAEDLDGDGRSALLEYALGSDDESFDGPPIRIGEDQISLQRELNVADTLLLLNHSNNLQDWFEVPESKVRSSTVGSDGRWTVIYNLMPLPSNQYYRVEAKK